MKNFLKQGFTLIELLIVIAIIGILTAVVTTNLQGARSRARDTRRKSDLRSIEQSLRLYYNDAKKFPASGSGPDYAIIGCGTILAPTPCSWGSPFATGASNYINSLPTDPTSSVADPITYKYSSPSADSMLLVATLENASDPDITDSQSRCSSLYSSIPVADQNPTDYLLCAQ